MFHKKCNTCGAHIDAINKVEVRWFLDEKKSLYFCNTHKKPYSYWDVLMSERTATLEVEEDGTPVGYKKIK